MSGTTKRELIASRILESESCVKKPKIQQKLFECPHCNRHLSEKTFKKHKLYFTMSVTAPGLEPQRSVHLKVSAVRVFL